MARDVQGILQKYKSLQGHHRAILGMDELSEEGQADRDPCAQDPALSCRSPSTSPRSSPVSDGVQVPLEKTIASFKAVVAGEYDHLPEIGFYMVGDIDDVKAKAGKRLAAEAA